MGRDYKRDVESVEVLRKKRECMQLRLKSWSHTSLADHFNVSISTISNWLTEMTLYCLPETEIEELRTQEAAKIDADELTANQAIDMLVKQGAYLQAQGLSVTDTLDSIRKWSEFKSNLRIQRAKMLGLNKPVLVSHVHKVRTDFDEELEALVAELAGGGKLLSTPDQVMIDE